MTSAPTARPGSAVGLGFLKLGSGEAIARIVAFGATVYLARSLGAGVYGVIVLATAILLYLNFLTDCGVDALGVREVAAAPDAVPDLLPSVLGARLLVGTALALVTIAVGLTLLPQPEGAILAAYALTLPVIGLGTRWVHLGYEQPGRASLARLVTELAMVALVLALVHAPGDLEHVPLAQVVGEGVGALVLLRLLPARLRRLPVRLELERVRTLFRASWPLILHALLGLAIFNSDFIFLRVFRDSAAVGLYAAAYTLISFFLNLGATYTMTLLPVITRLRDDAVASKALYDDSLAQVLAVALPVAVGGYLVGPGIVDMVFGRGYLASSAPLQVLIWSIPVALIRNVAQGALIAHQRQDQLMHTAAWAAATNVVLNIAFIPRWGLVGAASATLLTEVLRTTLAVIYTARLGLRLPGPMRFARIAAAVTGLAVLVVLTRHLPLLATIAAGATGYAVLLVLVGALRFRRGAIPEFAP